jgi:hypothetical protein
VIMGRDGVHAPATLYAIVDAGKLTGEPHYCGPPRSLMLGIPNELRVS